MTGERTLLAAAAKGCLLSQELVALLEDGKRTPNALRNAGRLMSDLAKRGYLFTRRVLAHDIGSLDVSTPVLEWDPRGANFEPDWEAISYHGCTRMDALPLRMIQVCWATEKAARLTGGTCGKTPSSAVSHDLIVSKAFLNLFTSADRKLAQLASGWTPAAELVRRGWKGERIPDAVMYHHHGSVIVEALGQYQAGKLREQHAEWRHRHYVLV
jgi:hypothetical protein